MAVPSRYKSVANCLFCHISLLVGDCGMMLTRRRRNRSPYDIVITWDTLQTVSRGDVICPAIQLVNNNECSYWIHQSPFCSKTFHSRIINHLPTFLLGRFGGLGVDVCWVCARRLLAGMKVCVGGCLLPEFETTVSVSVTVSLSDVDIHLLYWEMKHRATFFTTWICQVEELFPEMVRRWRLPS